MAEPKPNPFDDFQAEWTEKQERTDQYLLSLDDDLTTEELQRLDALDAKYGPHPNGRLSAPGPGAGAGGAGPDLGAQANAELAASIRRGDEAFNTYPGTTPEYITDPVTGTLYKNPDYRPGIDINVPDYIREEAGPRLAVSMLGRPEMADVESDPLARLAQYTAMKNMADVVAAGGLSAQDKAMMAETRAKEDAYLRGQRESTMANMQQRGMGGSGMELLAQMQAQQAAGQRMNMDDLQTAALSMQRRDAMNSQLGESASQARGQSWEEANSRAKAADAFRTMNWSATNDAIRTNWENDTSREQRNAAGVNDRTMYQYEEPFKRHADRYQYVLGNTDIASTAAGSSRADDAQALAEKEQREASEARKKAGTREWIKTGTDLVDSIWD